MIEEGLWPFNQPLGLNPKIFKIRLIAARERPPQSKLTASVKISVLRVSPKAHHPSPSTQGRQPMVRGGSSRVEREEHGEAEEQVDFKP